MTEPSGATGIEHPDLPELTINQIVEMLAVDGLGPTSCRRLLLRFGSLERIRNAHKDEFEGLDLHSDKALRQLRHFDHSDKAAEELAAAEAAGVKVIGFHDPRFPRSLLAWEHAPLLLYVKGEILERDAVSVAIVGARRASLYGKMHAERMAFELAQAGFTVVSGLAMGIDAAAHEGSLKGRGRTLAVLGNGLGSIYPPEHKELSERVSQNGAVISELPMNAPPTSANFPPRNRIIAGLALGVLVVEAARQSGALITAKQAMEMGREVFAIPGDIGRPTSRGPHRLIREGAKLVETVEDVIEELGPLTSPVQVRENEAAIPDARALLLNPPERAIYDLLDSMPKDIDTLTRESNIPASNVASILMVLQIKKLAVQLPGQQYVRAGTLTRSE